MPKKWYLPITIFSLFWGVTCFVLGIAFLANPPQKAQTRLAFVPDSSFLEECQVIQTLVETSDFKDIRDAAFGSGFSVTSQVFSGDDKNNLQEWHKRIKVTRIKNSLVLKVEAVGNNDEQSLGLSGVVAHVLAMSGGFHFRLDESVLVSIIPKFVTVILLTAGIILIVFPATIILYWLIEFLEARKKTTYDFSKFKKEMVVSADLLKPEDPRQLLQKFLDENRKNP